MPVKVQAEIRRLDEVEFGKVAYEVMGHAFAVHKEFGRLFDERIYQAEIARRCGGAFEVPVEICHGTFKKTYYLDLLVAQGALFELKTAEALSDRHRSQLLNYLLLTELAHGKLINMRTESVQHEFVNSSLTLADRRVFVVEDREWIGSPFHYMKKQLLTTSIPHATRDASFQFSIMAVRLGFNP